MTFERRKTHAIPTRLPAARILERAIQDTRPRLQTGASVLVPDRRLPTDGCDQVWVVPIQVLRELPLQDYRLGSAQLG